MKPTRLFPSRVYWGHTGVAAKEAVESAFHIPPDDDPFTGHVIQTPPRGRGKRDYHTTTTGKRQKIMPRVRRSRRPRRYARRYGRRYRRYRRRYYRRRRPISRRRVAHIARGMLESKRHLVHYNDNMNQLQVRTYKLNTVPLFQGTDETNKNSVEGRSYFVRGFRVQGHLRNDDAQNATLIRVLVYRKLRDLIPQANQTIFKTTETEQNVNLADWNPGSSIALFDIHATIDKRYCRLHRDRTFKLQSEQDKDSGLNTTHFDWWIPINTRVRRNGTNVNDDTHEWYIMYYAVDAEGNTPGGDIAEHRTRVTMYFKDT